MAGEAEFDGGGSVKWKIKNGDGESGGGDKHECKGKDKDPKNGGWFRVFVNDELSPRITERVTGNRIRVVWTEDPLVSAPKQPPGV